MKPWHGMAAASIVLALAGTGCGPVEAQEAKPVFEHGVLEWVHYRSGKEEQERYSWATAVEEEQRDTAAGIYGVLGIETDQRHSAADRMYVLDFLSKQGWQLVNRTDVTYTDAGGSAIAERYMLRRRR